ncbi:hypothetical protein NECAME_05750 [Necator americanus]|uniref:SXP/RAL-2 family protein Ani s 5-like cation-binding domain-containing protein n=1 Tax=Necator americanus TaxID=51031 RepID=W2TZD3_NECAM|nr:hypothetical protein NECAME_05750 [Necator americanus]ETN87029.1 hypothetical protein NECAME_05750 [Necator americanus]
MQSALLLGIIALTAAQSVDIISDLNLTKLQFEDEMNKWAEKYGMKELFEKYKKQLENEKKELDEGLKQVTEYFAKIGELANVESLTRKEFNEKRQELIDKLTPKQEKVVRHLECSFTPFSAENCVPGTKGPDPSRPKPMRPGPMRPGPRRPWPMGPGPMRPGPMGTGPTGPWPMGPGPMRPGPMGPGPMRPGPMGTGPMGPMWPHRPFDTW